MVWFRFCLIFLVLLVTGCGGKEKKAADVKYNSYAYSEIGDDTSALIVALRYPNAKLVTAGNDSTESYVNRDFVLRTGDSFPEVVSFYKRAFEGFMDGFDIGGSYSDDAATFTAEAAEGQKRLMGILVREMSGTLIVITHQQWLRKRMSI